MINLLGVYHYDAHGAIVEWAFCLARFRPAVDPAETGRAADQVLPLHQPGTTGKLGLPVLPDLLVRGTTRSLSATPSSTRRSPAFARRASGITPIRGAPSQARSIICTAVAASISRTPTVT